MQVKQHDFYVIFGGPKKGCFLALKANKKKDCCC